jgi:hypothetical protein
MIMAHGEMNIKNKKFSFTFQAEGFGFCISAKTHTYTHTHTHTHTHTLKIVNKCEYGALGRYRVPSIAAIRLVLLRFRLKRQSPNIDSCERLQKHRGMPTRGFPPA